MQKNPIDKSFLNSRVFGLDLLRALAVLAILLMHATQIPTNIPTWLSAFLYEGWIGVDLFFVLSGYLIGYQVIQMGMKDKTFSNISEFWIRRWTRTIPLYILILLIYFYMKPIFFQAPFQGEKWRFLFFIQNFYEIRDFSQSWSLCIEEQFYFFFPLVFFAINFKSKFTWVFIFISSLLVRFYFFQKLNLPFWASKQLSPVEFDLYFRFNTFSHMDGIAAGLFLSATRNQWMKWSPKVKIGLLCAGLFIVLATTTLTSYAPGDIRAVLIFTLLAVGFSCVLIGVAELNTAPVILRKVIHIVAISSYGAYLWNSLIVRFFVRYPLPVSWVLSYLCFLVLVFCISWITYRFIEKPGLSLRKKLLAHYSV